MNQRLIWNFEFNSKASTLPLKIDNSPEKEPLKWEIRFFWPLDQIIVLNLIDNSLLDISNYRHKQREDCYYLLPEGNYNIKRRRDELLYKPIRQRSNQAIGFGAKINLDSCEDSSQSEKDIANVEEITHQIPTVGIAVPVKKDAFLFKLPTTPVIKLELARLEVRKTIYFSACIEGKSLILVEEIAKSLLGNHVSCDYVTFLKNILYL